MGLKSVYKHVYCQHLKYATITSNYLLRNDLLLKKLWQF